MTLFRVVEIPSDEPVQYVGVYVLRWHERPNQPEVGFVPVEGAAPKTVRPDYDALCRELSGAYVSCNCGVILQTFEAVREHWQQGHFDYEEGFTGEADCPKCAEWVSATVPAGEEGVDAKCPGCGADLWMALVQYLSAGEIRDLY